MTFAVAVMWASTSRTVQSLHRDGVAHCCSLIGARSAASAARVVADDGPDVDAGHVTTSLCRAVATLSTIRGTGRATPGAPGRRETISVRAVPGVSQPPSCASTTRASTPSSPPPARSGPTSGTAPPAATWTASDLARHVLAVARWYHDWLDRAERGDAAPPFGVSELAARNAAALEELAGLDGAEAVARFVTTAHAYRDRLPAHWDLPYGYPRGTVTAGLHAAMAACEWHLHAWDLAHAVGAGPPALRSGRALRGRRGVPRGRRGRREGDGWRRCWSRSGPGCAPGRRCSGAPAGPRARTTDAQRQPTRRRTWERHRPAARALEGADRAR